MAKLKKPTSDLKVTAFGPLNIFQKGNDSMKVSPIEKTADYAKKLAAGF